MRCKLRHDTFLSAISSGGALLESATKTAVAKGSGSSPIVETLDKLAVVTDFVSDFSEA